MSAAIISLDAPLIIDRLNRLAPNSRLRAGYVDLLRYLRKCEPSVEVQLESALMEGLRRDPEYAGGA